MALNEETFAQRMEKLMNTQESIESTSSWCSLWRSDASSLVLWWEMYFSKADTPKRLSMIYLANDVIQTSRKRGPEFVREFLKVLPRALGDFMRKADEKSKKSVERVISVWEKRKVFGRQSEKIKELVQEAAEKKKPEEQTILAKAKPKEVAVVPEKVDLPEDVRALLSLVKEADLCSQKRIVAQNAYDSASEGGNVAKEILASVLLSYQESLKHEMENRMNVIDHLNCMIESQKKVYNVALSAASLLPSAAADEQPIVTKPDGPETGVHDAVHDDDVTMERYSPEAVDEDVVKESIDKNEADELAEQVLNNPEALLELLGAMQSQAGE